MLLHHDQLGGSFRVVILVYVLIVIRHEGFYVWVGVIFVIFDTVGSFYGEFERIAPSMTRVRHGVASGNIKYCASA